MHNRKLDKLRATASEAGMRMIAVISRILLMPVAISCQQSEKEQACHKISMALISKMEVEVHSLENLWKIRLNAKGVADCFPQMRRSSRC
jgi:hypothetical protein